MAGGPYSCWGRGEERGNRQELELPDGENLVRNIAPGGGDDVFEESHRRCGPEMT